MNEVLPHAGDFLFAERCLGGDEAALRELSEQLCERVRIFLRGAGAASGEADEIADSLCGDCLLLGASGLPRIASYAGKSSLQTWLNRVALNTLLERKRNEARWRNLIPVSLENRVEICGEESEETWLARPGAAGEDEPLLEIMREAIGAAFAGCPAEDFVLLQLAHCDGLRVVELARMFDCGIATISRRMERASGEIAKATLAHVATADPWLELTWEDFLALCRDATPACFGVD